LFSSVPTLSLPLPSPSSLALAGLRPQRVLLSAGSPATTPGHCLGERLHQAREPRLWAAPALLADGEPLAERWWVDGAPEALPASGLLGSVQWRRSGPWLHASACVDDHATAGGLQAAAQAAYTDLFALLQQQSAALGQPLQVLKVWNYLAQINALDAASGLERYRLFNIGRQDAFLAAGQAAFDGAPAACALGTDQGPLTVHLLAGLHAPRAVENPRQTSAYRYPSDYGPRAPTFSRAALADVGGGHEMLFISGTASIVGHRTVHVGDVLRQTEEIIRNLAAVLDAARPLARAQHGLDTLELTVYVRHAQDGAAVRQVLRQQLGDASPAVREALYLRSDICRADLLVEIEAQSYQPVPA